MHEISYRTYISKIDLVVSINLVASQSQVLIGAIYIGLMLDGLIIRPYLPYICIYVGPSYYKGT